MGERGPIRKPHQERQDQRADRRLRVLDRPGAAPTLPPPPARLTAGAGRIWRAFWSSAVAQAIDRDSDLPRLRRWIADIDEFERVLPVFRKARMVRGSTGQPVLNPLAGYLEAIEKRIAAAEREFGMTPRSRAALGLTLATTKLTAAQLNEMLERRDRIDSAEPDASWAEGFEPG